LLQAIALIAVVEFHERHVDIAVNARTLNRWPL